jgi:hypothetical protein
LALAFAELEGHVPDTLLAKGRRKPRRNVRKCCHGNMQQGCTGPDPVKRAAPGYLFKAQLVNGCPAADTLPGTPNHFRRGTKGDHIEPALRKGERIAAHAVSASRILPPGGTCRRNLSYRSRRSRLPVRASNSDACRS